jgi:hypothetical protein
MIQAAARSSGFQFTPSSSSQKHNWSSDSKRSSRHLRTATRPLRAGRTCRRDGLTGAQRAVDVHCMSTIPSLIKASPRSSAVWGYRFLSKRLTAPPAPRDYSDRCLAPLPKRIASSRDFWCGPLSGLSALSTSSSRFSTPNPGVPQLVLRPAITAYGRSAVAVLSARVTSPKPSEVAWRR